VSFLRRLLGGGGDQGGDGGTGPDRAPAAPASDAELAEEEAARDRELLRADAQRLNDDLIQRQMRYADRSWTPPAQGGERRADDGTAGEGG
jgi:hypothetical protein